MVGFETEAPGIDLLSNFKGHCQHMASIKNHVWNTYFVLPDMLWPPSHPAAMSIVWIKPGSSAVLIHFLFWGFSDTNLMSAVC